MLLQGLTPTATCSVRKKEVLGGRVGTWCPSSKSFTHPIRICSFKVTLPGQHHLFSSALCSLQFVRKQSAPKLSMWDAGWIEWLIVPPPVHCMARPATSNAAPCSSFNTGRELHWRKGDSRPSQCWIKCLSPPNIKWHGNSMFSSGKQRRLELTSQADHQQSDTSQMQPSCHLLQFKASPEHTLICNSFLQANEISEIMPPTESVRTTTLQPPLNNNPGPIHQVTSA